jgi:hypothetical protein
MKKIQVLSVTTYSLYWNWDLQLVTTNEDIIRLFLMRAKDRGEKLDLYHIQSSVAPAYDVEKFLLGEKLPACYLIN